ALDAAPDRFEYFFLDVFRVDHAVLIQAMREPDGEPAAACADFADERAVGNLQRVHDLIRLLPLLAIGAFEDSQVQRREQAAAFLGGWGREGRKGREGGEGRE